MRAWPTTGLVSIIACTMACGDDAVPRADTSQLELDADLTDAPADLSAPRDDAPAPSDTSVADADPPDAETAPPWSPPVVTYPPEGEPAPFYLSQTGLYRDFAARTLAPDLIAFEPAFELWSDGVDKRRWVRLPEGSRIDTSDLDRWQLPIGATLFKEFSIGGKLLETRVIARLGPGRYDYWMGAFIWDDAEHDARYAPDGGTDVRDSAHDVPSSTQCWTCHNGDPGHALGLSAIQLDAAGQLDALIAADLLSDPPATSHRPLTPPGDDTTRIALGYLHANCGHCHNDYGSARPDSDMDLRLRVTERTVEATATYRTTVGVALQNFLNDGFTWRIAPGDPAASAVLYRMTIRGKGQMPALGTEQVHTDGVTAVDAWIRAL